jgi:hypothetical protein
MKDAESIVRIAQAAGDIGKATSSVASMRALDALAAGLVGHRMFTGLLYHPDTQETERFYTNQPEKYPLGGRKPPRQDRWSSAVIDRGEIFFLSDAQDVKDNFADAATLLGIGIGSGMCLPVRFHNRTLGTINVLAAEGAVSKQHGPIGRIIAALAVPAFEAEHRALRERHNKA